MKVRINGDLRGTPRVRVIGSDGKMLGVMPLAEALRAAMKEGLDLVEVNPRANPPVCKILDLRKFKYAEAKKLALQRQHPRVIAKLAVGGSSVGSDRNGRLLERYRNGEHEAVWQELRQFAVISGAFREEALDVAHETMRRVLHNVQLLSSRLVAEGWEPLSGSLWSAPSREDVDVMKQIEDITGAPLPPSLRAFWEIVGGVDFVWNYQNGRAAPDFGLYFELSELDPLAVDPARVTANLLEEWTDRRAGANADISDSYRLYLAPDCLHKADVSGGPPYGVELPFLGADPIFANEPHGLPFVDYLRMCVRWGGFPGLERHVDDADALRFLRRMTEGIQPF